jgi:anti-sigma B factor antagonist
MEKKKRRLLCEPHGDVTVVYFVERKILDELNIKEIGDELFDLIDNHGKRKLLINFENVEYLSSAALGKLITLNKKVHTEKGQLKLCRIHPTIFEVFRITKLDKLFEIYDEEATALEAFE